MTRKSIHILLVEDNPHDARLTIEVFKESSISNHVSVAKNGEEALAFLKHEAPFENESLPDLILLDLNLPKKNGYEVLTEIKSDPVLRKIPVIVLSTSSSEEDIARSYDLHVNSYVTKPVELDQYIDSIKSIQNFWFSFAKLPPESAHA